ncbi:TPA: hypothetical protein NIG24_004847 [Pseudomonas aeruginosa]|uniref:hypothetical protein n=1 Tax=Pseudomonas aeruginosa TaxID=287 RepID=UPI00295F1B03|nr:hypothetical protein [Pseudomonas aeruginosa]WOU13784.1 hypothetical protein R5024_00230 [Pseudomonas aeruginosa]HCF5176279.1 hypothetical protein [Pseudomonas aeruginosa]
MGSDFFGFSVHVYLREDFPKFLSGDFFCELNSAGIKRLKEYFSSHLAGLKLGGVCNDLVYFPLSGDLKFRFMDGEVYDSNDGCFTIGVFFNCRGKAEGSSNSYFGFESVVDVVNMGRFCDGMDSFLR